MRKSTPQKLGSIIQSVLSERGYQVVSLEAEIAKIWPSVVGEKISQITTCSGIRDGVLCVHVTSSAWRQELSFLKKQILDTIVGKVGKTALKDIQFY